MKSKIEFKPGDIIKAANRIVILLKIGRGCKEYTKELQHTMCRGDSKGCDLPANICLTIFSGASEQDFSCERLNQYIKITESELFIFAARSKSEKGRQLTKRILKGEFYGDPNNW